MVATKMAPNRAAAVNLGKQMVARDLFHHVVHAHDFEVQTCMLIIVFCRQTKSYMFVKYYLHPQTHTCQHNDRITIISIALMRATCRWIRAMQVVN